MWLGEKEWSCVQATIDGDQMSEQWCPRGLLPSRADLLLSRNRVRGPFVAPAAAYPDVMAQIVAQRSFVRPALQVLSANDTTAAWMIALSQDVLMGDSWRLQLVHMADEIATTCTLELSGPAPQNLDPALVKLIVDLVAAPDGVEEPTVTPSLMEVESAIEAALTLPLKEQLESWLQTVENTIAAAELLPPSLEANLCIGRLATRLAGVPGAAFFGFSEESARLHRIVLRRGDRQVQPGLWAFSVRGALLALADVADVDEVPALVTACRAAIAKPNLVPLEQATLHHCEGELLLRALNRENYESAVVAFSQSRDAATELGAAGQSYLLQATTGLARAYRLLGRSSDEADALTTALSLIAESDRSGIEARLDELRTEQQPKEKEAWENEAWVREITDFNRDEQEELERGRAGRVMLKSPLTTDSPINILLLRPLVTANSSWVPNRFVNLLRHAWRFRDEPTTLTFEETLSRALGHRCSFASKGGDVEGFGIGRIGSAPSDEAANPEQWRTLIKVFAVDPLLSPLVIVYPSDSPGMQWELDLLASHPCDKQIRLFMIPPSVNDDGQSRWLAAKDALSSRRLTIPEWHPDGLLFHHDANGNVAWSENFTMLWEGRLAFWVEEAAALVRGR